MPEENSGIEEGVEWLDDIGQEYPVVYLIYDFVIPFVAVMLMWVIGVIPFEHAFVSASAFSFTYTFTKPRNIDVLKNMV
ncbi:hypothetical protein [Halopiger goleimassiliensis]|uniref:hypothetical protein n=1 Tax=Halopiger goleimassiliensis TaxID=1293048 RepID=UPI000677F9A7|nr:hypothetical protein [Halopiger goleimassiliensis]